MTDYIAELHRSIEAGYSSERKAADARLERMEKRLKRVRKAFEIWEAGLEAQIAVLSEECDRMHEEDYQRNYGRK